MNKDGDKGKGVVYLNTEKGEREWLDQIVQGKKIPQSLKLYISLTNIFLMNLSNLLDKLFWVKSGLDSNPRMNN